MLQETDLIAITIALVGLVAMNLFFFRNNYLLRKENLLLRKMIVESEFNSISNN